MGIGDGVGTGQHGEKKLLVLLVSGECMKTFPASPTLPDAYCPVFAAAEQVSVLEEG